MTAFLIRKFIKDSEKVEDPQVRHAYGRLGGITGISANVLLFLCKLIAGLLTGSLSIMADSLNNLSDAGSAIVTLVGFKLSAAPPDEEHPFGHGRSEYLATLLVAVMIMIAGFQLASASVQKILHPEPSKFGWFSVVILVAAIGVKLWLAMFYKKLGRRINSEVLIASGEDSRNDVICSALVLVSLFVDWLTPFQIDGVMGTLVALFVMWTGFSIIRHAISPLLGQAPDPKMVEDIRTLVLAQDGIIGVHDLMIHNYGPGRCVISLHAEVPANVDMLKSHDVVDQVEKHLMEQFHATACIHMDPVDTEDERLASLKSMMVSVLYEIDPRLSLHDFRAVFGETHTNLIFDVVIPFRYQESNAVLAEDIQKRVAMVNPKLFTVITVEHRYT